MYNVSQAYIDALKSPAKVRRLTGTIGSTSFTEDNVLAGSLHISNACSEGNEVKIGSVYMGTLTCVFTGINLTGQWKGKKIALSEWLLVDPAEEEWEEVPLGVYTVSEANHQEAGVYVTAYDDMNKIDGKTFVLSTTSGTPYDYMDLISRDCGVTLQQTEAQIRALPNGTRGFVLYSENDIQTYRDLLFWTAQTCGCFATINRSGKLELRLYGNESVYTIEKQERWIGSSFSDFSTRYTGVSVVNIDKGTTYYRGGAIDDALTYNLGSNPLLQVQSLDLILDDIIGALARIDYTPYSVSRSGCPALDLGDQIAFSGGIADGKVGCVMSIDYTFHGGTELQGFGSDPALANAKSKTDKQIAGLLSKDSVSEKLQIYNFTNLKSISISDSWKQIMYLRFGSLKATMAQFHAEIKLTADNDGSNTEGLVRYRFNNEYLTYQPAETWIDGDHILHLMYVFPIAEATVNVLEVDMKCTAGTATIWIEGIHGLVFGQGLMASDEWTGYIEVTDYIEEFTLATEPTVQAFSDDAEMELVDVILIEATERISEFALAEEPTVEEFVDAPYINKRRLKDLTWGEVKDYTWAEILELFNW